MAISVALGRERVEDERRGLGNALLLLLLASVGLTLALSLFADRILHLFGARDVTLEQARTYFRFIALGASFQIWGTGLVPLLRAYGRSMIAMGAMIAGFTVNIVFDWLFISVLGYGMAGAAWATIMGQAVTTVPCLLCLAPRLKKLAIRHVLPRRKTVRNVLKTAASPFGLAVAPYISLMFMNKASYVYGGDTGVAAYAVASWVFSCVMLLMQGVGDGSQPLFSFDKGLGDHAAVLRTRKLAWLTAGTLAVLCSGIMILGKSIIPVAFGASHGVADTASRLLPLFSLAGLCLAFLRVTTSYCYATRNNRPAWLLIYVEPVFMLLLLIGLPRSLGLQGVWLAIPSCQILLYLLAAVLLRREKKGGPYGRFLRNPASN